MMKGQILVKKTYIRLQSYTFAPNLQTFQAKKFAALPEGRDRRTGETGAGAHPPTRSFGQKDIKTDIHVAGGKIIICLYVLKVRAHAQQPQSGVAPRGGAIAFRPVQAPRRACAARVSPPSHKKSTPLGGAIDGQLRWNRLFRRLHCVTFVICYSKSLIHYFDFIRKGQAFVMLGLTLDI